MKLSFSLKSISSKLGQNLSLSLALGLLVLLIAEGLVIRSSISILFQAQHIDATPPARLVRVNFGLYDSIAKRFDQEISFTPTPVTAKSPFDVPPKAAP